MLGSDKSENLMFSAMNLLSVIGMKFMRLKILKNITQYCYYHANIHEEINSMLSFIHN